MRMIKLGWVVVVLVLAGCALARVRPDGTLEAVVLGQAHASATGAFVAGPATLRVTGGALSSPGEMAIAAIVSMIAAVATGTVL